MSDRTQYNVFLSYNSLDREHVERIAEALEARKCSSFIDRWYFKPGHDWVQALEHSIQTSQSAAIFLGPNGMGRWQQRERSLAMALNAECDDFLIIPVLLPGCESPGGFLKQFMWIDLRNNPTCVKQIDAMAAAILGKDVTKGKHLLPNSMMCPYRGLLAFREEDSDFFFGREAYLNGTNEKPGLLELVKNNSLVAVVGASGSGKSSLVNAGLIPALRRHGLKPVWEVLRMVPNLDPLHSLADAILPLVEPTLSGVDLVRKRKTLADDLEFKAVPLWDLVNELLRKQPGTDRLLLIVDQWEELYTICEKKDRRKRFIEELLDATLRKGSSLSVVLTVRGDFYDQILLDRPLVDRLQNAELKLGPMNHQELRSVIIEPAANVGLTYEEGLVDVILRDAGAEPGLLPLLEFALEELWKNREGLKMTHTGYKTIGQQPSGSNLTSGDTNHLVQAIATYAEQVYQDNLDSDEQDVLPSLARMLVHAGAKAEEDTRRRVVLSKLSETEQIVARKLANKRLLVSRFTGADTGPEEESTDKNDYAEADIEDGTLMRETTVEVAHEELLRRWDRLKQWVNDDREFLRWLSRMTLKAEEYKLDGDAALLRGKQLDEAMDYFSSRKDDNKLFDKALVNFLRESANLAANTISQMSIQKDSNSDRARELAAEAASIALTQTTAIAVRRTLRATQRFHLRFASSRIAVGSTSNNFITQYSNYVYVRCAVDGSIQSRVKSQNLINSHFPVASKDGELFFSKRPFCFPIVKDIRSRTLSTIRLSRWILPGEVKFSSDSNCLLISGFSKVYYFDISSDPSRVRKFKSNHYIEWFELSKDSTKALNASDSIFEIWDTKTGQSIRETKKTSSNEYLSPFGCFSPNSKLVAVAGSMGHAQLWKLEGGDDIHIEHGSEIQRIAFSPCNNFVATGGRNEIIRIWDIQGKLVAELLEHSDEHKVDDLFSALQVLFSARISQSSGRHRLFGRFFEQGIRELKYSSDGTFILSATQTSARVWDAASGTLLSTISLKDKEKILGADFMPCQQAVALTGKNKSVAVFDLPSLSPESELLHLISQDC